MHGLDRYFYGGFLGLGEVLLADAWRLLGREERFKERGAVLDGLGDVAGPLAARLLPRGRSSCCFRPPSVAGRMPRTG